MSAPILITALALGGGWLALSKARSEMPNGNANTSAGDPVAMSGSDFLASTQPGTKTNLSTDGIITDPDVPIEVNDAGLTGGFNVGGSADPSLAPSVGGADPSTLQTPKMPSFISTGVPSVPPSLNPKTAGTFNASAIVYGTEKGLTRSQKAQALAKAGGRSGMVW